MKPKTFKSQMVMLRICIVTFILVIASFFLFSFTVKKMADDFLAQLGINKSAADEKITNSVLGGSLDAYGLRNVKNIVKTSRTAVTNDLLNYTKKYLSSDAFLKQYAEMKLNDKPEMQKVQTAEEMRKSMVDAYKKSIEATEVSLKTADANMKPMFEKLLEDAKKALKDAEDPNNKQIANYAKNYEGMMKSMETGYQYQLAEWEKRYPADAKVYIKRRLEEFMNETKDIDFSAELKEKDGMKVFVNPAYERKSDRWKMAYRAGKEVVEPARKFVAAWLAE
ncbi:hypothetical protein [Pollutibacter soli]|uniref:hypothetical protein n=1 Tax=Pollutibacter soli TaxID=3034157 RepID=UPI003013C5E7